MITYCKDCHNDFHQTTKDALRSVCGKEVAERLMQEVGMDADAWEAELWPVVENLRLQALIGEHLQERGEQLGSLPDDAEIDAEGRYFWSSEGCFDEDGNRL